MFWFRYLAVLLIGTAAVWFLAPKAGAVLRERIAENCASGDGDGAWANGAEVAGGEFEGSGDDVETPEGSVVAANGNKSGDEDCAIVEDGNFSVVRAVSSETSSMPSENGEQQQPEPRTMSLERIWQSSGDVAMWGVVSRKSPAYGRNGKKLPASVPGGTLAEITKTTFTDKGDQMALCALWDASRKRWTDPILVPANNIAMFDGTRDGLFDEDVSRLMEFCGINAAIVARKEALDREVVDRNPHAARLREIDEDNRRLAAKTKELTEKRDSLAGAARNRVADELREMEVMSTEISLAAKRELALYEEWKKAHPAGKADYMRDPQYRELKQKLRAALPDMAMFGISESFFDGSDGE